MGASCSSTKKDFPAPFIMEFPATFIMEFLDTASLVRFSQTNKYRRSLLQPEVARRKRKLQEYEMQVKQLVGGQDDEQEQERRFTHAIVEDAKAIVQKAKFLISCEGGAKAPFFRAERKQFIAPGRAGGARSPLAMLPDICFVPSDETAPISNYDAETAARAEGKLVWLHPSNNIPFDPAKELANDPAFLEAFRAALRTRIYYFKRHAPQQEGELDESHQYWLMHILILADKLGQDEERERVMMYWGNIG
jgi:hypothetical protein